MRMFQILSITMISTLLLVQGFETTRGSPDDDQTRVRDEGRSREVEFIENLGQVDESLHFYSTGAFRTGFMRSSMRFVLQKENGDESVCWDQRFIGSDSVLPEGEMEKGTVYSYFIGRDRNGWASGAGSFLQLRYRELYPGIDMVVGSAGSYLKYDLILEPHAPSERIMIGFEGISHINVEDECISIVLPDGTTVREGGLLVHYGDNGEVLKASFRRIDDRTYGYDLGDYDRSREVVIDPVVFSTLIGGSTHDQSDGVTIDHSGNVYVTGSTSAWGFPTTPGSYRTERIGRKDAFVARLTEDGKNMTFCTLLGGSMDDTGIEIELDGEGNVYVAGWTVSDDVPASTNAFCSERSGNRDLFLAKLDPTGTSLSACTYFGGAGTEDPVNLVLDDSGNSYIGGWTDSNDLPVTNNNIGENHNGGDISGFLFKMDSQMSRLHYSTYISSSADDRISGLSIDDEGNAFVTGMTRSDAFLITDDALDSSFEGSSEAFLLKIDPSCSRVLYGTYIGGAGGEGGYGLELDIDRNIWITGITYSDDFPVTGEVFQSRNNGNGDLFIMQINGTDHSIMQSTFLGGSGTDSPLDMTLDGFNRVSICGETSSTDLQATDDAIQSVNNGGYGDGFALTMSSDLREIVFLTYIGGDGWFDSTTSIDSNLKGEVALTGWSDNETIPTTEGAFDETHNGWEDVYVMKFSLDKPPSIPGNFRARSGNGFVHLTWNMPPDNGTQDLVGFDIFKKDNRTGSEVVIELGILTEYNDTDVENGNSYTYRMRANNLAMSSPLTERITIVPIGVPSTPPDFDVISGIRTITIRWTPSEDNGGTPVIGYRLTRTGDGSERERVLDSGSTEIDDLDVVPGTEYGYHLTAFNRVGHSPPTEEKTGMPIDRPSEPLNVRAVRGNCCVLVNWTGPEDTRGSPIRNYNVYRTDNDDLTRLIKMVGPENLQINDTMVVNGVSYSYHVTAVNAVGESEPSESVRCVPADVPSVPLFIEISALYRGASISWEAPATDGGSPLTGYQIRRELPDDETLIELDPDTLYFEDTGLENGRTYTYSLRSISAVGPSYWTDPVEVMPLSVPGVPILRVKSTGIDHVQLFWEEVTDTGGAPLLGYRIYREVGSEMALLAEVDGGTSFYNDTSVASRIEYVYFITAFNAKGESGFSEKLEVTPLGAPSPPVDVELDLSDGEITISWSEPEHDGGSEIVRLIITRLDMNSGSVSESEAKSNDRSFTDIHVVPGREYGYRVTAVNSIGRGTPSEEIIATALSTPEAICGLRARFGDSSIVLSWDPVPTEGIGDAGIEILRSIDGGDPFHIATIDVESTFFEDVNIRSGASYSYQLRCVNAVGSSEPAEVSGISVPSGDGTGIGTGLVILVLGTLIPILIGGVLLFWRSGDRKDASNNGDVKIEKGNGVTEDGSAHRPQSMQGQEREQYREWRTGPLDRPGTGIHPDPGERAIRDDGDLTGEAVP